MSSPAPANNPPLLLPRGLIFLSSVWLIASFIIAIGVRGPLHPSSTTFTPAVRDMLTCIAIGLMIGWPLLRLSQSPPTYPIRQTLLDLLVLIGLLQVVLWPLRLVTNWSPLRTAAIDATLAGWLLLAGAVVASAIISAKPGPRILAMAACLAMCLLGPALAWLGAITGFNATHLLDLSPIMAVRTLGESTTAPPTVQQWNLIALLGAAVGFAWVSLFVAMMLRQTCRTPGRRDLQEDL